MLSKDKEELLLDQWMDYSPRWARVTFRQMMYYGVHLGHSLLNSNPYSSWMIAGIRQGMFLIDLFKFSYMLRVGLFALEGAVRCRGPIWFIHPQKGKPAIMSNCALRCGEYFYHYPWVGGLITNHRVVRQALRIVSHRKDAGRSARERLLWAANFKNSRWKFSRRTWPRAIFVSSARLGIKPCHEAQCVGIPALAITDTNSSGSLVSIAIPANEEALTAVWFYNNLISLFILHRKFGAVNLFFWRTGRYYSSTTSKRTGVSVLTSASLFSSRDLWRGRSLNRILEPVKQNRNLSLHEYNHPWLSALAKLAQWSKVWNVSSNRTSQWMVKALVLNTPPFHRSSFLLPKIQRGLISPFGVDRPFHRLTRYRGPYRSRQFWIFYQIFTGALLAMAARWLNPFKLRRLWRRPYEAPSRLPQLQYLNLRRKNLIKKPKTPKPQYLRHPWADYDHWQANLESVQFPALNHSEAALWQGQEKRRSWQDRQRWQDRRKWSGDKILSWNDRRRHLRHRRDYMQISRYAARSIFGHWFCSQ